MDEIVFTREQLRRLLLETAELLNEAAAKYDPEADMPFDDFMAAMAASGLSSNVRKYAEAVAHRIKQRSGRTG